MPRYHLFPSMILFACLATFATRSAWSQSQIEPFSFDDASRYALNVTSKDARILLGGSLLTLAATTTESPQRTGETVDRYVGGVVDIGDVYGSAWGAGAVTLGLGSIGLFGNKPSLTNAAIDLGKSLAVTASIVAVLKVSVDRTRPSGSRYSFPSGHTATAFTVSTVLDKHFGWKVGVVAYATAALTGLARMEDDHHYLSDVIAGATIGLLVGRVVPSRCGNARPYVRGSGRGVGLSFQF